LQYLSDICPNIFQYLFKYCLIVVSEFNCGCFWPKQRKNYPQTLIVVVGIFQRKKLHKIILQTFIVVFLLSITTKTKVTHDKT